MPDCEPPPANPASSPDSPRGLMVTRLETALADLGEDPGVDEVLQVLAGYPPIKSTRCMNPKCTNSCTWPDAGGRPPGFCQPSCRVECLRDRDSLRAQDKRPPWPTSCNWMHRSGSGASSSGGWHSPVGCSLAAPCTISRTASVDQIPPSPRVEQGRHSAHRHRGGRRAIQPRRPRTQDQGR